MSFHTHPFTLRQLQYAVAVYETLNFRKAAERCAVSQPSLSAQLAQLEDALDTVLFERNRRRVLPTRAGEDLVRWARRVLVAADDLVSHAKRHGDPLKGELVVGVIPTVAPYLLPRLSPVLATTYPALRLLWVEDKTEVLVRRLAEGTMDAALLALEAELGDVEHAVVSVDPFLLAMPRHHRLASLQRAPCRDDLDEAEMLLLEEGHCLRDQALAYCGTEQRAFRATSLPTLVQMVSAGLGVTLLPEVAREAETGRADLALRTLADPPSRTLVLAWRPDTPIAEALRTLAATMAEAA